MVSYGKQYYVPGIPEFVPTEINHVVLYLIGRAWRAETELLTHNLPGALPVSH